jgi:arylformamidase
VTPRFIDLSHTVGDGSPSFPGDPVCRLKSHAAMPEAPCNVLELGMSSHQGTHLDAPYHFYEDGRTVDEIALERFFGPAALVDLAPGGVLAPGTPLTMEHFAPYADRFTPGARVLYRTGWDRWYGRPEFFTEFPTLTLEATRWIAERRIGLLGMDTPTPSVDFLECHRLLLAPGLEIVIVESLAGLERLPARFTLAAFPLKLGRGDGSPIRAVALVE